MCFVLSGSVLHFDIALLWTFTNHDDFALTVRYRSLDIMYSYTLYHLITHSTRLNSNSAFLIDNIFTNNLGNKSFSGLSLTDISDYLPIFPIFRISMKAPSFFRDDSEMNVLQFNQTV